MLSYGPLAYTTSGSFPSDLEGYRYREFSLNTMDFQQMLRGSMLR